MADQPGSKFVKLASGPNTLINERQLLKKEMENPEGEGYDPKAGDEPEDLGPQNPKGTMTVKKTGPVNEAARRAQERKDKGE